MSVIPTDTKPVPGFWAIIPAAGVGARMVAEVPKQYLSIGGRTILEHTLDRLFACKRIEGIVLALSADDGYWPAIAPRYDDNKLVCVTGGAERCHSVLNALQHLATCASPADWVLVHDAARPCVRVSDIDKLVSMLFDDPHGGLLGVPVSDTMKRADADGRIFETVERQGMWHAQTPQMFRIGTLHEALEAAIGRGVMVTDEASAMELAGHAPRLVQGHADNIKVTVPSDLALAEFYLQVETA